MSSLWGVRIRRHLSNTQHYIQEAMIVTLFLGKSCTERTPRGLDLDTPDLQLTRICTLFTWLPDENGQSIDQDFSLTPTLLEGQAHPIFVQVEVGWLNHFTSGPIFSQFQNKMNSPLHVAKNTTIGLSFKKRKPRHPGQLTFSWPYGFFQGNKGIKKRISQKLRQDLQMD